MGLFEVLLKVSHDCPFCNLSAKFPTIKMFTWCNGEHDVIEIILENPQEHQNLIKEISV